MQVFLYSGIISFSMFSKQRLRSCFKMSAEIVSSRFFDDFVLEMREHTGWYVTELKVQKRKKDA